MVTVMVRAGHFWPKKSKIDFRHKTYLDLENSPFDVMYENRK